MKIKEILANDKSLLNYYIEVNGEPYNEHEHGDMIHLKTEIGTHEEYNHIFNVTFHCPVIKFTAIEQEKIQKLLEGKDKDVDTSLSDYMDKRIKEISEEE